MKALLANPVPPQCTLDVLSQRCALRSQNYVKSASTKELSYANKGITSGILPCLPGFIQLGSGGRVDGASFWRV